MKPSVLRIHLRNESYLIKINEMSNRYSILLLWGFILFGMGCEPPVQDGPLSAATRTELDQLAGDIQRDTEEKYHILGAKFVELIQEANRKGTDGGAAEHIVKFVSDNETALTILRKEIDDWYKTLPEEDRIKFMLHLLAEDYPRQLRQLVPQIDRRLTGFENAEQRLDQLLETIALIN